MKDYNKDNYGDADSVRVIMLHDIKTTTTKHLQQNHDASKDLHTNRGFNNSNILHCSPKTYAKFTVRN